jgi:hypothetical protein
MYALLRRAGSETPRWPPLESESYSLECVCTEKWWNRLHPSRVTVLWLKQPSEERVGHPDRSP